MGIDEEEIRDLGICMLQEKGDHRLLELFPEEYCSHKERLETEDISIIAWSVTAPDGTMIDEGQAANWEEAKIRASHIIEEAVDSAKERILG